MYDGLTYEEFAEIIDSWRERARSGLVSIGDFRQALARHGFNAHEIEGEVAEIKPRNQLIRQRNEDVFSRVLAKHGIKQ